MKLDRNINKDGTGKYALIKLRKIKKKLRGCTYRNGNILEVAVPIKAVDFGDKPDTDFFVIRLKDKYANAALMAYANEAWLDDKEYAEEIFELARKAREMKSRMPD